MVMVEGFLLQGPLLSLVDLSPAEVPVLEQLQAED